MSRLVKRVDKRFKWPRGKVWFGYTDVPPIPCQSCNGTGKDGDSYCCVCEGEKEIRGAFDPPGGWASKFPELDWAKENIGWQMWETVSEGSPMSPVCDSPEELARWLADNNASAFASMTATYEQWLATIRQGGSSTMVMGGGKGLRSGVEFAAEQGEVSS